MKLTCKALRYQVLDPSSFENKEIYQLAQTTTSYSDVADSVFCSTPWKNQSKSFRMPWKFADGWKNKGLTTFPERLLKPHDSRGLWRGWSWAVAKEVAGKTASPDLIWVPWHTRPFQGRLVMEVSSCLQCYGSVFISRAASGVWRAGPSGQVPWEIVRRSTPFSGDLWMN